MGSPARFLAEQAGRLARAAGRGAVLDLACGRGRNLAPALRSSDLVIGIDRNAQALAALPDGAHGILADLETGLAIPLKTGSCGAVLVFRFLFRPLAAEIQRVLAPGGLLLYETFTIQQRDLPYGPENPVFLLEPGELPGLFPGLETLVHQEGLVTESGRSWATARLAARKSAPQKTAAQKSAPSSARNSAPKAGG